MSEEDLPSLARSTSTRPPKDRVKVVAKAGAARRFFDLIVVGHEVMDVVKMLEDKEVDPDEVDVQNGNFTALHFAAELNLNSLVKHLFRAGATVDAKDVQGNTPLHLGAYRGSILVSGALVQEGANVEATNNLGYTPLLYAAGADNPKLARMLLDKGANPSAADPFGWTPLHWAAFKGNLEMARMLIKKNATGDVVDKEGLTPLDVATIWKRGNLIKSTLSRVTSQKFKSTAEKTSARLPALFSPREADMRMAKVAGIDADIAAMKERIANLEKLRAVVEGGRAADGPGVVFLVSDLTPEGTARYMIASVPAPSQALHFVDLMRRDNVTLAVAEEVHVKLRVETELRARAYLDSNASAVRVRRAHQPSLDWYACSFSDAKQALAMAVADQLPRVEETD